MFSFTLQVKSEGYKRTRHTRVYVLQAQMRVEEKLYNGV